MDGEIVRPFAEFLRRRADSLGEDIPQALAVCDHLQHAHHGLGIAKAELEPIGVPFGDDAVLVALHGEGDEAARGDGVQAIGVADLIGL